MKIRTADQLRLPSQLTARYAFLTEASDFNFRELSLKKKLNIKTIHSIMRAPLLSTENEQARLK